MTSFALLQRVALCCSAGLAAGCSAQAGPEYSGEPLLTFSGAVVGGQSTTAPPAKAGVLWYGLNGMQGSTAPVIGSFPSRFTLSFYAPPPARVFSDPRPPTTNANLDRGPLLLGWIVALAPDTNELDVRPENVLGYALDTMVVYLPRDAADPDTARYAKQWNIPPKRGYHLVKLERIDRSAYDQCQWNGLCVNYTFDGGMNGFHSFVFSALQADYETCITAMPAAPRCTVEHQASADLPVPAGNAACFELMRQFPRRPDCEVPLRHVPNAEGFATEVTITMGATFRDVFM